MTDINIIFGTESGNSERIAKIAHATCQALGLDSELIDMAQFDVPTLADMKTVLLVCSTNGEGDMPMNAEAAWEDAQKQSELRLPDLKFAVLALGDSSYDYFCQAGKDWEQFLRMRRARPILERVDIDGHYMVPGKAWVTDVLAAITGKSADEVKTAMKQGAAASGEEKEAADERTGYHSGNPWEAKIVEKRQLSADASGKRVRHYSLSLAGSDIEYKPGDCIDVVPVNQAELVDALINCMRWDASESVSVDGQTMPLRTALLEKLEIRSPTLKLLKMLAAHSSDLDYGRMMYAGDKSEIEKAVYGEDVLSLVQKHTPPPVTESGTTALLNSLKGRPSSYPRFEAQTFISYLKPLQPRAYSIASSQAAYPDEVHLTIADVNYMLDNEKREGVCSNYLAQHRNAGDTVKCWLLSNKYFAVPEDDAVNTIMIGPGTGIAPFIGFLQERAERKATGENWLFFGDREEKNDFIYQDELKAFQSAGVLNRLDLAFSRDQAEKIYVQHRMAEQAEELFKWLEQGAYLYICGDARTMAADVENTLLDIIEKQGNCTREAAQSYVNTMKREKRYVRDVY